ncbi:MAG TPA: CaiB/BaiF CoA-transferase family protein [Thermoanaerobaculia bacterium]|nr:CaiB/BaiF CoA-transferase family protein [Thermoanaerobaculia bacterium]
MISGTLVVDLSRLLPGPLAGRLLADLGARVVKVEEPSQGDPVREAPPRRNGQSGLASLLLSGIESVALDLKEPDGREVLSRLLERADVLLESFRPGTLARLGFPPDLLRERYPRLVVCSISGWGQSGPYASRAGHDLTYQAVAGSLAPTGGMPSVPVVDMVGAWSAVSAILAALLERHQTGRGRHIDAALLDAGVHANFVSWAVETGGPKAVGEALPLTGALPCYRLYRTADGRLIALGALEPHFWKRLCDAAGCPGLRKRQYSESRRVRRQVEALVRSRTLSEWMELFAREDIPAEPVLSAAEAREHPQVRERGMLSEGGDMLPRIGFPALVDGVRPRAAVHFPALGEHTDAWLHELGLRGGRGVGRRFSWRRLFRRALELGF